MLHRRIVFLENLSNFKFVQHHLMKNLLLKSSEFGHIRYSVSKFDRNIFKHDNYVNNNFMIKSFSKSHAL